MELSEVLVFLDDSLSVAFNLSYSDAEKGFLPCTSQISEIIQLCFMLSSCKEFPLGLCSNSQVLYVYMYMTVLLEQICLVSVR